jgi:hypothetical protein
MKRTATLIMAALIVAGTVQAREVRINRKLIRARQNMESNQPGTSGHVFGLFKAKVQNVLGVTITSRRDMVGKAGSILVKAHQILLQKKAAIQAASNLGETKAAIVDALDFMADLHRIELFIITERIRREAKK